MHARLIERLVERNAGAIVFDIDFSRAKPGDEDAVLARAIAEADRVVLFEWLAGRRERVITASGGDGGWTWVEQMQPPTPVLAAAAKALGPFPLPKIDQAAFEFWAFKSSAGDAATTAAVALQVEGAQRLRFVACRPQGREGARRRAASRARRGAEGTGRHAAADADTPPHVPAGSITARASWPGDRPCSMARSKAPKRPSSPRSPRSTPAPITTTSTSMVRPAPSARSPTSLSCWTAPARPLRQPETWRTAWSSSAIPISTIRISPTASIRASPARTGSISAASRSWPPLTRIC